METGPSTREPVLCILALGLVCQLSPLHAQQTVDLRSTALPRRTITVAQGCSVVGDGTKGRPDGLHSAGSAAPASDGSLLILNAGSSELLRFDSTGRFAQASSRAGEGPGELSSTRPLSLRGLRLVKYRGDSVAVYDAPLRRISVFDSRGRFGRAIRVDTQPAAPQAPSGSGPRSRTDFTSRAFIIGATADGDFILVRDFLTTHTPTVGLTVRRDSLALLRVSATGTVIWISPPLEDSRHEILINALSNTRTATGMRHSISGGVANTLPTERFLSVAVTSSYVHHYSETLNELHAYNRLGQMTQRILLPPLPVPMPPARGEKLQKQRLSMSGDTLGRIWIEVPHVRAGTDHDWWIVTRSGEIAATATTPAQTGPLWIGATSIILQAVDSDGVETIRICGLRG